ncbi:isoprenylcysteine carboxylmethyltransferase family protein [Xanthobacter autotrophicus]|uniref:protein-S-isoprenylcysteine O-methyltransferase n=1 Tax=Xanthobacter TaxID=279 RepID=UPI0024AC08A8|nr:protein-S-isoprenylcysteine O-methyltransferase [Xanthobacter autotrophicus]MDI4663985.1 isoprenylcysteine carboxylmethyltransferase family protein [Xanthobacter autotrophicus]
MSLVTFAKIAWAVGVVSWYVLRIPFERRAKRQQVADARHRTARDMTLLTISTLGLGVLPAIYAITSFPRFASYAPVPAQVVAGVLVFVAALWLFWRTHRQLGRNWSVTLEIKDKHKLITSGVYERVRHPMYSAFFLWALAQALLLPNLIAGPAGLVGFGTLFFFRVGREERMMREAFGAEYEAYEKRTKRVIPGLY